MVLTLRTDSGVNDNVVRRQLIDKKCTELTKRLVEEVERGFQEIMKDLKKVIQLNDTRTKTNLSTTKTSLTTITKTTSSPTIANLKMVQDAEKEDDKKREFNEIKRKKNKQKLGKRMQRR